MARLIILLLFLSFNCFSQEVRFALITPRSEGDLFWGPLAAIAKKAANDLGIVLDIFYAEKDHFKYVEIASSVMAKNYDGVITLNFKQQGKKIIQLSDRFKIPTVIVTGGFTPEEKVGRPREKHLYWIGELLPDDVGAGRTLLNELILPLREKGKKINIIAIEGNIADSGARDRKEGLFNGLRKQKEVKLLQVTAANWSPELAKHKYQTLSKSRYREINAVWAASDGMGLGVIEAIKESGKIPGGDILVGGVDWSRDGLDAVERGEMVTSIGGHIMQGAWAVILLHDYLKGSKLLQKGFSISTSMEAVRKKEAKKYIELIYGKGTASLNFKSYSQLNATSIEDYRFSVKELFK